MTGRDYDADACARLARAIVARACLDYVALRRVAAFREYLRQWHADECPHRRQTRAALYGWYKLMRKSLRIECVRGLAIMVDMEDWLRKAQYETPTSSRLTHYTKRGGGRRNLSPEGETPYQEVMG